MFRIFDDSGESGRPFGTFSFKKWVFILAIVGTLAAGAGIAIQLALPARNRALPLPAVPVIPPAQLVDNLEARLAHLQSRVRGVEFQVHRIKQGENLWKIASRCGYSVHTIIGCNPQMETYDVRVNQAIVLPSLGGTLHRIQENDTWQAIAERYRAPLEQLKTANAGVGALVTGEMIFIPGSRPDITLLNDKMRARYEMRALFVSPLGGRLSSLFGTRKHPVTGGHGFHGGIDIAVKSNSWVGAAADGVVTVASDNVGHYGKAVFIEHGNGYVTHYGHLSSIHVRVGQKVKARQLIAKSGATGRVTGPHLHFTIKKDGVAHDPLKYIW